MPLEVILQDARAAADAVALPAPRRFAGWANAADTVAANPARARLTVRVVDATESRRLNARYRGKDRPTNVLSFGYEDDAIYSLTDTRPLLGDLVMCAEVVRREARAMRRGEQDHWAHLTIHGVLHLMGYDHDTEPRRREMEAIEIKLLQTLAIGNPYTQTIGG